LLRQLFCCAKGYELSRLGIGWDDVSGGSASAGGLAFKLAFDHMAHPRRGCGIL